MESQFMPKDVEFLLINPLVEENTDWLAGSKIFGDWGLTFSHWVGIGD